MTYQRTRHTGYDSQRVLVHSYVRSLHLPCQHRATALRSNGLKWQPDEPRAFHAVRTCGAVRFSDVTQFTVWFRPMMDERSRAGEIWYARVSPSVGGSISDLDRVSESITPAPRRVEPEVHQAAGGPHILYTQNWSSDFSEDCGVGDCNGED